MSRYARKKDGNHNEIISYAIALGFQARDTSRLGDGFPDSLMSYHLFRGLWVNDLWEIKDGKKGTLTPDEIAFFDTWRGPKAVIRSIEDVCNRRLYWLRISEALSICNPSLDKEALWTTPPLNPALAHHLSSSAAMS